MDGASLTYRVVAVLLRFVLRLLYRVEVRGDLRHNGRTLIIANHESFLDAVLLGAFLPVKPIWLVHTIIAEHWFFRLGLRYIRHTVTDTSKPLAIKTIVELVESGEPVVIFPEGRITVTGSLMKVYDGPGFVAAKTECSVVPVHIGGSIYTPFSKMQGDFPKLWFPKITITIAPATTIPMPEAPRARERRRLASEQMRRVMQNAAYTSRKRTTLFEALLDTVAIFGKKRRVLEDVNSNFAPVSYGTIIKGSLALGRLAARITREGEAVGVLMPNANATVMLLFGLTSVRRVAAMLNYSAGVDAMQNACRAAQVKTVLTSRAFVERANLAPTIAALREVQIVYLEDLRKQFGLADKLWLVLWAVRNPRRCLKPTAPDDPAAILFTSGSEGQPKGVVLSHDSILANTAQVSAAVPFAPSEKFMSALPLFHAFGITVGILVPLLKGCRVVLYVSPLHYRTVPEFTYDHDCTVLFSTNTFLAKYARAAHPYDFYNLKYLVVGAEKLTDDVRDLCFEKFGIRALEGYGATECSPAISFNTPLSNRRGTVGEPLPGIECRIAPVPGIDGAGVLHVKGDNVMLGYLRPSDPGVLAPPHSQFGPGWYETGDVVSVRDGFLRIEARLKRFAKVAGEMISLEVVERMAVEASRNAAHAACTFADGARGESIILFTEDPALNRSQLQAVARQAGAPDLAVPRRIVHLDEIPLLANGKKDYVALSRLLAEEKWREVEA